MTARPMTDEELAGIIKWAAHFVEPYEDADTPPPLRVSGDAMLDVCRALLSTSASVRGMREALYADIGCRHRQCDSPNACNSFASCLSALSGIETGEEKEQATRADDGPTAPISHGNKDHDQ